MRNKKFVMTSHEVNFFERGNKRSNRYTMFMAALITIAEKPRVITTLFRNGTGNTTSPCALNVFLTSIHLKIINNKNAILQINVNLDKKLNKRISRN